MTKSGRSCADFAIFRFRSYGYAIKKWLHQTLKAFILGSKHQLKMSSIPDRLKNSVKSNNKMVTWALLTTGWGKNAKDIIDHSAVVKKHRFKISLLIYEQDNCGAAESAKKNGVETIQIKRADFENATQYQDQIINVLKKTNIDYIFLLNYKYLVRKDMLNAFPKKILNVHPSLFPSFLGTKTAIQDALDYGVKITGITTHLIDDEFDKGTILLQKAIRIHKNDTFETLYPKFSKKGKKIILKTMRLMNGNSKPKT